ncbi:MAG: hypothetical protein U1E91_02195 [Moraxella sp.]
MTSPSVIAELGRIVKTKGQLHLAIPVAGSFGEVRLRFPCYLFLIFYPVTLGYGDRDLAATASQEMPIYHTEQSFAFLMTL